MTLYYKNESWTPSGFLWRHFGGESCYATIREDGVVELSSKRPALTFEEKVRYAEDYLNHNKTPRSMGRFHNATTCYVRKKNGSIVCGHSVCNPCDQYSYTIGCAIALMRAIHEKEEVILPLLR